MDANYGDTLAAWNSFYDSVAAVAATLVGLLFVGLALNPKIMNNRALPGLNALSGQTFHSFLVVLVLALIAQIPDDSRRTLIISLLFVGVQGIGRLLLDLRRIRATDPDPRWRGLSGLRRFASPLVAYGITLWIAWAIWQQDDDDAFAWMVAVIFLLMMDAVGNCWDILKEIGEDQS
jgi:hypothetical protein